MYTVVEIDKTGPYIGEFTPYTPYVYSSVSSISSVASYWTDTFLADGEFNTASKNITSVVINSIYDVESVETLNDCMAQENSFYFDFANQILYIHYPHTWTPASVVELSGVVFGFASDTVRYFRNQIYRPIVKSIPSLSDQADPLQYGIMAFGGGAVTLVNDDGLFDVDEKLYGNVVRIKMGEEGYDYDDLIPMFSGYIRDYTLTTNEFKIDVADKRERLQVETPEAEFLGLTGLVEDTNGKLIPDGYGDVIQAPAYPHTAGSTSVRFRWATVATSISNVYTYTRSDGLVEISTPNWGVSTESPLADGYFYILNSAAYIDGDTSKNLVDVYVTGRMRDYDNPADIISDMNSRLIGVEYNSSNYNTTEWEEEKAYLDDISLYMDKQKPVYEWIELIQNGTNWGFRYEDVEKITLRRDDPDRTPVATITPIDIRNSDIPVLRNAELYASSCKVKYAKNTRTDTYAFVENKDYEDEVVEEHRIKKVQEYESLLTSEADALEKALRVMEDVSVVRPIVTIRIDANTYKTPRIYDMISATVSLIVGDSKIPELWTFVVGDTYVLGDSDSIIGETHGVTFTEAYTYDSGVREYFGELTGQVIGISWIPEANEIELKLRSR